LDESDFFVGKRLKMDTFELLYGFGELGEVLFNHERILDIVIRLIALIN